MSKKNKKGKAKKQGDELDRLLQSDSGGGILFPSAPLPKLEPRPAEKIEPVPTDPVKRWWYDFKRADPAVKLQMVRDKLPAAEQDPQQLEFYFPDSLDALTDRLPGDGFTDLLDEIQDRYPQVFDSQLEWNAYYLSFVYVDRQQWDRLDALIARQASKMTEIFATFFALVSLLRLAGREATAQQLIEAGVRHVGHAQLMSWGYAELCEWANFPLFQRCIQEGVTDEILDAVVARVIELGGEVSDTARQRFREIACHVTDECEPWTRETLHLDEEHLGRRCLWLHIDFARWLVAKGLPPIAADELRLLLPNVFDGRRLNVDGFLAGIDRHELDHCVRQYFQFMSLHRVRGPATVLALHRFFEFLHESNLVDDSVRKISQMVCTDLWNDMQRTLGENWKKYRFLEEYWQ